MLQFATFSLDGEVWKTKLLLIHSMLSAIDLLPAVNIHPCIGHSLLSNWKVWFVTVKRSTEEHHDIPCLKWQMWGHLSKASPGHSRKKKNRTAGFAGFCMDDSHVLSCAWEWVMITVWNSDSTRHPHGPCFTLDFFYAVVAVCLHVVINKIWEDLAFRLTLLFALCRSSNIKLFWQNL